MSILAETLVERVAGIITRYSMLSRGDRVGVAVSGGADSTVLLHILQRLSKRLEIRLVVLHLNHGLRGVESDQDEEFVRELANQFGLELVSERCQLGDGNLEQAARRARQEFYRRSMSHQPHDHALQKVALGHTRSDQAETVLFRMLRGSGLAGLAGMRWSTENGLIRPLLTTSRDELREWAAAEGIRWREDSSNFDLGFTRNRLRHVTLPGLTREFNPHLERVLAGTAEMAQAEEDYWSQQIETLYAQTAKQTRWGSVLHVPQIMELHVAQQRRLIRRALLAVRSDLRGIDREHVDAILRVCGSAQGHDRVLVPGVDAIRSFDTLLLAPPGTVSSGARQYCVELKTGEERELPFGAGFISATWANSQAPFCASFKGDQEFTAEVADLDGSTGPLYVRNWQPGDQLQRLGHTGKDKVKSLFQEHRVLLWERRHWPVVVAGEDIVWVRRFGAASPFAATAHCQERLRLVYRAGQ
jgi:tRNA(Ile)-lysidine synthase